MSEEQKKVLSDQELLAALAEIVHKISGKPVDEVTPDKSFADDLELDSLGMDEVAASAEDDLGIKIPDEQLNELKTVQDVIDYVHKNS
jgi:acyl carrier protein